MAFKAGDLDFSYIPSKILGFIASNTPTFLLSLEIMGMTIKGKVVSMSIILLKSS